MQCDKTCHSLRKRTNASYRYRWYSQKYDIKLEMGMLNVCLLQIVRSGNLNVNTTQYNTEYFYYLVSDEHIK